MFSGTSKNEESATLNSFTGLLFVNPNGWLGEANASGRMSTSLFPGCGLPPRHTHRRTHAHTHPRLLPSIHAVHFIVPTERIN